jgi:type I restriction enzyme S subunit
MSKIDEIIQELCPEGVRHLTLADLAIIGTGSSDKKDADPDGQFPFYVRSKEVFRAQTSEFDETAILIPGEGGIGEIFHFQNGPYALHQRAYRVSPYSDAIDPKFLYFFMVNNFRSHIMQKAVSATVTSIRKPMIESFSVALPPLEVQKEIVSILDKFTQLEAELEAELEARRTQYEVTRDRLLDFNSDLEAHPFREMMGELCPEGVEFRPMGSIGNFVRGQRFVKDDIRSEGQACIHYGEVYTKYHLEASSAFSFLEPTQAARLRKAKPGDVVIAAAGETIEDIGKPVVWSGSGDVVIHDALYAFQSPLDPKFVAYFLRTDDFKSQARPLISSSKISAISIANFGKITIPNPPLEVQKEIVTILDKLDALVNDITIGLPAEIAARRKQYEYYRNKLLTFKELDAA